MKNDDNNYHYFLTKQLSWKRNGQNIFSYSWPKVLMSFLHRPLLSELLWHKYKWTELHLYKIWLHLIKLQCALRLFFLWLVPYKLSQIFDGFLTHLVSLLGGLLWREQPFTLKIQHAVPNNVCSVVTFQNGPTCCATVYCQVLSASPGS